MRSRILGGGALLGLALAGCLFPSFDDLRGDRQATTEGGAPTSSPTTSPSADSGTGGRVDAGVPPPPPPGVANSVPCERGTCATPGDYCCANMILDDGCRNSTDEDPQFYCGGQSAGKGRPMFCDGPEDCATGQQCCFVDDDQRGASCTSAACGGSVMCHDDASCPVGKTCSGRLFSEQFPFCR